jgi:hypothetical protein
MKLEPEYLSLTALASYASVSLNTCKKWEDYGMPTYRIGRCIWVKKSEFDEWIQQFRNGTSKPDLDSTWDQAMEEV